MIKKILLSLSLTIITHISGTSQVIRGSVLSYRLSITDTLIHNVSLFLYETYGNKTFLIDSVMINTKGGFEFKNLKYAVGYYVLGLNDSNRADIILNPNEPLIEIEFLDSVIQNKVNVISSAENKILWDYKYFSRKTQDEIKKIQIHKSYIKERKNKADLSAVAPAKADSILLDRLIFFEDSFNTVKHNYLNQLLNRHPGTFFSKVARSNIRPDISDKKEQKKHFFDAVDFSDSSLLRSNIFPNAIMDYFFQHTEYNEVGFYSSVDRILKLATANPEVYEYCLNFVLELFNRVGPDIVFQYIVEEHLLKDGCSDMDLSTVASAKAGVSKLVSRQAAGYRALMPGNKAPDIALPDSTGTIINLNEIIGKSQYTVLFFWSSHCPFCHKAFPSLIQLYSNYSSKGLEIVGISLDVKKEEWLQALRAPNINWINLCDMTGWKSVAVENYKVHKTPGFFVLDNKQNILMRPKTIEELAEEIKKLKWE